MATRATICRRLEEFDFDYPHWQRAQEFYRKRGFELGYGGRGRYRGLFHASHLQACKSADCASWVSVRQYDPTSILDAPSETMRTLLAMHD